MKSIPQHLAEKEVDAPVKPYTAINAYHFKFDDIAKFQNGLFFFFVRIAGLHRN